MRNLAVILLLFVTSACIREMPLDMPDNSNGLVVSSIIYPDKLVSAHVSYINLFANSSVVAAPSILEILLLENGVLCDRLMGQGPEIYSSTYPKEGAMYQLTVTTDKETVTASTTIPGKVLLTGADFWLSDLVSQEGDRILVMTVSWEDPPSENNFYDLQLLDSKKTPYSYYQTSDIVDPILIQECDLDYWPGSFVFSDKKFSGGTGEVTFHFASSVNQRFPDTYVKLRNISEEYYHFLKSWYKHRYLQNTSMNVESIREDYNIFPLLFQGDPVPLYTNINQGFGVFAGFTEDIRKFKLKK